MVTDAPTIAWRSPEVAPESSEQADRVSVWRAHPIVRLGAVGAFVLAGAAALAALTIDRLDGAVTLFLSPDGAHYLEDADALVGRAVRPLAHPPAFPGLIAATRPLVGGIPAVHLSLGLSLALLVVSLYVLCRQFVGVTASIVGAGIGATFPAIAELVSWNGGATLLATALLVLALAANEWWLRSRSAWGAAATGLATAGVVLSHPFVAAVALVCIGARWLVAWFIDHRPPVSQRGGPFSVAHLVLIAVPVGCAVYVVLPYYNSVEADAGVQFGFPRFGAMWDTLVWGLREQGVLLLFFLIFALAVLLGGRAAATLAVAIGAVYLVVSSASKADPSYRTRVAYLLPIIGALGVALLWQRFAPPIVRRLTRARHETVWTLAAGLVAVMIFASLGYLPRLPVAGAFYQRLAPVDVTALRTLSLEHGGLVATSWNENAYGNGISNAWYVEGLARRQAAGPTDPALSTIQREQVDGAAMQQFFAGVGGVQNGTVQLALGPTSNINTPGLQAFINGMYRPVLYVNDDVNAYPGPLGRATSTRDLAVAATVQHAVTSDGINGAYFAAGDASPRMTMTAVLRGRTVVFDYHLLSGSSQGLTIRLYPGYGVLWRNVRVAPTGLTFVADPFALTGVSTAGPKGVETALRGLAGSQVRYLDQDPQFGLQSIEVSPSAGRDLSFSVNVAGPTPAPRPRTFDQQQLIRHYHISDVVLWKDTGWRTRFSGLPCFEQTQETLTLLIYKVAHGCGT